MEAPGSKSLIAYLGENGSDFIDTLLGMAPSNITEFDRSDALTPNTSQRVSVVDNELWGAATAPEVSGSFADLGEREGQSAQRVACSDSVGSDLRAAINFNLVNAVREEGDQPHTRTVESPSQRKRFMARR